MAVDLSLYLRSAKGLQERRTSLLPLTRTHASKVTMALTVEHDGFEDIPLEPLPAHLRPRSGGFPSPSTETIQAGFRSQSRFDDDHSIINWPLAASKHWLLCIRMKLEEAARFIRHYVRAAARSAQIGASANNVPTSDNDTQKAQYVRKARPFDSVDELAQHPEINGEQTSEDTPCAACKKVIPAGKFEDHICGSSIRCERCNVCFSASGLFYHICTRMPNGPFTCGCSPGFWTVAGYEEHIRDRNRHVKMDLCSACEKWYVCSKGHACPWAQIVRDSRYLGRTKNNRSMFRNTHGMMIMISMKWVDGCKTSAETGRSGNLRVCLE
jgi:hypothetical protein